MELAPRAVAAGVGLTTYEAVSSTNAEALGYARRGERGPAWVTALTQSAGRGRRGRSWVSQPGNLYASLLLIDPAPAEHAAQLSFVTALAVHDALSACAPALRSELALKWPNDVLCGGAKLAGILIEGEGGKPLAVAVGIGINIRHHPGDTELPATDLAARGADLTAEQVFTELSGSMLDRLAQWDRGTGFPAIRADWLARAGGLGRDIRVRLQTTELVGRFTDLDASGRLLLTQADGTVTTVAAGDVFPLG
jgi:BirA family transcriptional regulator, biotin operon repressor / biotin---[acetyl-CoA-carboxylase] ligase